MVRISGIADKIFSSKAVKNTIKFASDNPALFASATTVALSTVIRPAVILATPKTDKDDKKYAIAKSLTSSAVGLGLSYAISKPIEKAVKQIDKAPELFLTPETVKNLSYENYMFLTRFIKMSTSFLSALPKSMLTCALLPFVAKAIDKTQNDKISFGGKNFLPEGISKILGFKPVQDFAKKFSKTNLVQNISFATDLFLTGLFVNRVKKNKDIPEENKKPLINNSIFSTGLSLASTVVLNKASDKATDKFIKYFLNLNKGIKNPQKYAEGIKTVKTVFVMGGVYYAIIPFVSTLLSSAVKKLDKSEPCLK